jgi:hypothetical protein
MLRRSEQQMLMCDFRPGCSGELALSAAKVGCDIAWRLLEMSEFHLNSELIQHLADDLYGKTKKACIPDWTTAEDGGALAGDSSARHRPHP